jgi:cysteine synthase
MSQTIFNQTLARDVSQLIGLSPLVYLKQLSQQTGAKVYAKLDYFNPGCSIKDRIAVAMLNDAEAKGLITPGKTVLVEPTSGNTGIALAMLAAARGYQLILTMPETMSLERRRVLKIYGAKLVLTPAAQGMKGAIARAEEILATHSQTYCLGQFKNPANPNVHRETTAQEIWNATQGQVDMFIAGVGTGGTITGVGEVLKANKPTVKIYAVEPQESPVLSGGQPGPHKIQGIGAGFIPDVLNTKIIDQVLTVSSSDALAMARTLARTEGLMIGISSGATAMALQQLAQAQGSDALKDKTIVVMMASFGERYLSSALFEDIDTNATPEEELDALF